ncbi:ABC transporter ATP-binding protein [Bifidobacterium crudilactis]|jgi:ABC-2 type transport system ATP-binding protein|uniref:ABC transporter ATP-binding protein n=1 Tax=Bifidobacterium crudilactis TaxID=327277 RepID=UPI002356B74B|nr:polysaccharide ABC transporter ATP-binding protein [Bifidobacterium crudilactis]MCI1664373.1 polysaccharide ABC transporter ATP-binding protein [Bifidobacterium crudilactis]MCI1869046.1 polysaccharide ABC transporter ATP-binding protein [Bifidobacterium crudilactis]
MSENEYESRHDMQEVALRVKDVSKSFKLPTDRTNSLKVSMLNWIHGIRGYKVQHVLKNISFDVYKGDFFGIVGKNGSGKSTLLKIVSQIYSPDTGDVESDGKLVPFIELGVGFNPELTGRENVYLNGAMLGFTNEEIDGMYDDIVDFAELHDFMEQKLKNYSSGMQVRLAFSVAIKSQGDILVLDEVLAVGDEAFQKKCQDYFFEAKRQKKTIILVTHSMGDVRRYCNRAMFIQDGKVAQIGDPDDIADAYSNSFVGTSRSENEHPEGAKESEIRIKQVRVLVDGAEQKYIEKYEDFDIEVTFTTSKAVESSALRLDVVDGRGWLAFSLPERGGRAKVLQPGNHRIVYSVQNTLAFGDFHIDVAFDNGTKRFIIAPGAYQFHMRGYAVAAMPLTIPHTSVVVDGS